MPPPPSGSQKGTTGKRTGGSRDMRQSRSRNTTPSSIGGASAVIPMAETESKFLELTMNPFPFITYEDVVDTTSTSVPDSKTLDGILEKLKSLLESAETRSAVYDRGMRLLAQKRKDAMETERLAQEQRDRDAADEAAERGKHSGKMRKRKDSNKLKEERPLTHGAHGVAPQDGSHTSPEKRFSADTKHARRDSQASASSSLSPPERGSPAKASGKKSSTSRAIEDSDESSDEEHQPPPAPAVPHVMTFGDDPWDFNDPTIYEIKEVTPDMSDEEKKKIYSVADYPHNDLAELIPGDPPDMDFSNQKPPNQVQASTFNTYVEAYLRPFTEEDLAFLRDRGDRTTPFTIPRRGKKHYTEIWAEEDGLMTAEQARERQNRLPENQPRGSLEDLDENIAETDAVSTGPLASRVLSLLRPEHRQPPSDPATTNGTNENADLDSLLGTDSMTVDPPAAPLPSATYMPDSATEGWKKNMTHPQLDHHQIDERLKQELRHLGFMPMDEEPDYDAAEDDEIAARMRVLQERLRVVSMQNGAKKRLLMDMTKERMAYQEYATIREDLDTQVQTNFTKRNRTIGKKTKAKRPGGAGGGSHTAQGMARPGIGEPTKLLMEKRKKWIDAVGPVFSDDMGRVPRSSDPDSSIFKEEVMAQHLKAEKESWDEEADEE